MRVYWLDFGGGDAEYSENLARMETEGENVFICVDPRFRSHMIEAKTVRSREELPSNVFCLGAGLGPSDDCANRFLPFRTEVFQHVVCRFVLHLYLTIVEPFITEAFRVLAPGGDLTIRIPDWENEETTSTINFIATTLTERGFTMIEVGRVADMRCSMWDEVYEGRAFEVRGMKQSTQIVPMK